MSTVVRARPAVTHVLPVRRRSRRRRWLMVALVVLVVALAAAAVVAAFTTPVLGVRQVEVVGTSTLEEQVVREASSVDVGEPMLLVDPGDVEARIEAIPEVASVDVVRRWPGTVHIAVVEREAVAVLAVDDGFRAVDRDGDDFAEVDRPSDSLPVIEIAPRGTRTSARIQAAVDVVVTLPDSVRARVSGVTADSPEDVRLTLTDGPQVRWGSAERPAEKAVVLAALLLRADAIVAAGEDAPAFVDVSSPDVPTTG